MFTKAKAPVKCANTTRGKTNTTKVAKHKEPWHTKHTPFVSEFQRNRTGFVGPGSTPSSWQSCSTKARKTDRPSPDIGKGPSEAGGCGGSALMPCFPNPLQYWKSLPVINQVIIDWLIHNEVKPLVLGSGLNPPLKIAYGHCADDGWFDPDPAGKPHIAILIEDGTGPIDVAFWHPRSGRTSTLLNYGLALGEHLIENPGVFSFGGQLNIYASPLDWLKSGRDGIFVLDWPRAFDRLRYCPAVAVDSSLLATYRAAMQPQRLPGLFVIADALEAAT